LSAATETSKFICKKKIWYYLNNYRTNEKYFKKYDVKEKCKITYTYLYTYLSIQKYTEVVAR
jgi:hypothetical protein